MTITSEIRSFGGNDVEVEVLYLGFSGAWYVSKNVKRRGLAPEPLELRSL